MATKRKTAKGSGIASLRSYARAHGAKLSVRKNRLLPGKRAYVITMRGRPRTTAMSRTGAREVIRGG